MPIKDPEARKAYQKAYALKNKEKAVLRVKEWRAANPGARTEEASRYRENYPEQVLIKANRWIASNPEKAKENQRLSAAKQRAKKPEVIKARKLKYARENKHVVNAAVARRKAAKLQRTPAWLSDFNKLKIQCIYSIAAMLTRENKEPWHVDHKIPLQGKLVSGLHVPNNLQVMRGVENVSKKNKYEVEYA